MFFSIPLTVVVSLAAFVAAAPSAKEDANFAVADHSISSAVANSNAISLAPTPESGLLQTRQQSAYQIQFFSGTSCTGSSGFFGGDIANRGCISVTGNFDSVRLRNAAGCSTAIFTDGGCSQSRFLLTNNGCSGYSDGSPVKGITVNC